MIASRSNRLTRISSNALLVSQFKSSSSSVRNLQIYERREKPGFFDQISGMYENGQHLEGKPLEFRDGRFRYYIGFLGTAIVAVPTAFGILWAFFCLFSYTTRDSQVVVNRRNPHPFLQIKNGLDMNKTFNPILGRAVPFSVLNQDYAMMFYNELNKAKKREL
ncbi:predicted protein [Naegleria gruberi]|uniref:Predicted protein n=1 Tax=Naegleria gruberi TaxID=5762 RepID=D2V3T2_NAEGR|nr:uncharacterized protein NAEGRDRAFT_31003 [Naegleria gruberi]EFC48409.1 predicted protein [Naegleria gruberi]|eukprot:XP_002681153.1 predicted protein [Naegleria gruberi strain NEG-M]